MAASIVAQHFALDLITDKVLTLGNEEYLRTFNFGSSWTKVRLGVMCSINQISTVPAVTFAIGVCSGKTNGVGAATTTNFVGINLSSDTGITGTLYANYGPPWYASSGGLRIFKKVGSTVTSVGTNNSFILMYSAADLRYCFFVDITKGNPDYTLALHRYTQIFNPYLDTPTFNAAVNSIATPPVSCSTVWTTTLACDESAGALDTFNVFWSNSANWLDVGSLAAIRLIP